MRRVAPLITLVLGISLIAGSGPQLLQARQAYVEADAAYQDLRDQVVTGPLAMEQTLTIEPRIDFNELQMVNADAVAWLYCPDTVIDYPIVQATDYSYYLYRLLDRSYNPNGTLFIDYNNAADFSEQLTVVYGHHMASGMMFASLVGYKDQSYYDQHPIMYLYTPTAIYQVDLIYGCLIGVGQWRERAFMYQINLPDLIAYAAQNSTFISNSSYIEGDQVIAMSTCSYEFNGARYVVIGVLNEV